MQINFKQTGSSLHHPGHGVSFQWLGQAGVAFTINTTTIFIDPYLSDSLAEKYHGTTFPHNRMMAAPVEPRHFERIDWVFCTHRHTDHMDPVTLQQIHRAHPLCQFLIPKAWAQRVHEFGIPKKLIMPINADETVAIDEKIKVHAIPAAHEIIERDAEGHHLYLGYILATHSTTIYHSGDCVPYPGLADRLRDAMIDVAFLPVNGRDEYRKEHGVPGNFTVDEAVDMCIGADIPHLVCTHFGMFSFNTIDETLLNAKKLENLGHLNIFIPEVHTQYQIDSHPSCRQ